MEAARKFVRLDDFKLSYLIAGSGSRTILCFHGHGKDATDYLFLADDQKRIISVDLFLHGHSTFDKHKRLYQNPLKAADLHMLIQAILRQEQVNKIDLLAYSQGGRFALALIPKIINQIENIYLVAIDGLNDKNIYSWTQRRKIGRKIFKYFSKKPKPLEKIASLLVRLKIIHPKLHDLLLHYTADQKSFERSYEAWAAFRELRPNELELQRSLKQFSGHFILMMGQYDQIITVKSAKAFLKRIQQPEALKIVNNGHDFFKPESKGYLKELLAQN
jgi:pimeloyl-ACP methyl ester carboxylesterase